MADRQELLAQGRCPSCLHPVLAHPDVDEPEGNGCIGAGCGCTARTTSGWTWAQAAP